MEWVIKLNLQPAIKDELIGYFHLLNINIALHVEKKTLKLMLISGKNF